MTKVVTYVDLFCGLGAFHLAFDRCSTPDLQYQCLFACDIDPNIRKLYHENFGLVPEGDLHQLENHQIPTADLLCAGFPCQPFSVAGQKQGFADPLQGTLIHKVIDILRSKLELQCPIPTVILENVKNILTMEEGKPFREIVNQLESLGYHVSYQLIDSKDYGSPQSRKRVYLIASLHQPYHFPEIKLPMCPVSSIIDFSHETYLDYSKKYKLVPCPPNRTMIKYRLFNLNTGKGGYQGYRVYSIDNYGPTICANSGGPGARTGLYLINGRIRTLTIGETLKMFGFPSDYQYRSLKYPNQLISYLGNSIVVEVLYPLISFVKLKQTASSPEGN